MNDIFSDDIFNSLFNDTADADVSKMFGETDKKPEEEKKAEEPVKGETPAAEEKTEESAEEPKAEAPVMEEKAEEPEAEAPAEPVAEETTEPAKEEPVEEAPAEEPKAEDVKEEVETADAAEESGDAESDTSAETDAASEEAVEADAPATEEAEAAEPAEPVVEVKVEKKHRRRRTKKAKTEEKAEKTEEPKAAEAEEPASSEINEAFLKSLILVIGPKYKDFRDDINDRINKISIQPDMPSAVINSMIAQNNELEKKLMIEGQGYYDAYTNLTDKETGLIASTRAAAEAEAEGTVVERRYAGQVALTHYKFPATGEIVNLLQYANALKQVTNFLDNVKSYVKSTGIALNTMRKVA